jgi:hypothetical protein
LNLFASKILQNDWFSEKTTKDALKIINNIKYIKLNLDYVLYCVENKNDLSIYRFPSDQRKGVLRDRDGTSFHINSYQNANQAKNDLSRFIADFEAAAHTLTDDQVHPIVFLQAIEALEWENEIGCIEKRTEKFLKAAVDIALPSHEQLAHVFIKIYIPKANHPGSLTIAEAVTAFEQAFSLQDIQQPLLAYLNDILSIEKTDTLSIAFDSQSASASSSFPVAAPPNNDLLFELTDDIISMDEVISLLNSTDTHALDSLLNKNCPINKRPPPCKCCPSLERGCFYYAHE